MKTKIKVKVKNPFSLDECFVQPDGLDAARKIVEYITNNVEYKQQDECLVALILEISKRNRELTSFAKSEVLIIEIIKHLYRIITRSSFIQYILNTFAPPLKLRKTKILVQSNRGGL